MKYLFRFELIQQEPFEAKALQCIMEADPVGLLKKCQKRQGDLKKGTRRLNWQLWTACYAGALGIHRQPDLFAKLLEDEYFKQRTYKSSIDDVLRLALLIGTDADTTGRTYKNACHIASRLQPLFDAEVEPKEVLERIEAAGGLKSLDISDLVVIEEQPDEGDQDDYDGDDDDEEDAEPSDAEGDEPDDDEEYDDEGDDDEPAAMPATAHSPAGSRSSERRGTALARAVKAAERRKAAKRAEAQSKRTPQASDHVAQEDEDIVILEVEVTKEILAEVLATRRSRMVLVHVGTGEEWQRIAGTAPERLA